MFLRQSGFTWLVVGLGNPGARFESTRHNMGFMALDRLADREGFRFNKLRFRAWTGQWKVGDRQVLVMKPQTYMNLSGRSVLQLSAYFGIPPQRIIVMFDDISLEPGRLRVRAEGSAGGHNGIKSIIASLGTDAFPRVKVGVGDKPHPDYDLADWVLSAIAKEDQEAFGTALHHAAEAVLCIVENGTEKAAAAYNGK